MIDVIYSQLKWILLSFVCVLNLSCVSNGRLIEPNNQLGQSLFRAGIKKMSPKKDEKKPLAAIEYGGWVETNGMIVGAHDENWIGAFDFHTMKPKWWLKNREGLAVPSLPVGDSIILGFRSGDVVSVDRLSGKELWSSKLDSFVDQAMVVKDSRLFVMTATQTFYCLDLETGKVHWVYDIPEKSMVTIKSLVAPVFLGNKIFFGTSHGAVYCLNILDGAHLWSINPEVSRGSLFHNVVGELVVYKDKLIVTRYDGWLGAISLSQVQKQDTPAVEWSMDNKFGLITTSRVKNGSLFVATLDGYLHAIDLESGALKWKSVIGGSIRSLFVGEEQIYVITNRGVIFLLDRLKGKIIWHDSIDANICGQPLLVDKYMVFPTGMNNLYFYRIMSSV